MSESDASTGRTSAAVDLSGLRLGSFRLLRRLGRGAMAEVYLAEQELLGRRVAVKILKPELANDQVYLKRFQREAQAAASLVHANIVQIYEVGHTDGFHYIAQEYVEGQNLRQWITRQGPPDLAHSLSIMRQTAAALAKAAEQGIVHRDIKPENIMLTHTGEVKVADFGLARFAREGDTVDLTQTGMTLGTPLYMSPEQVEGKPLDPRSDLYSLGVTCYHMLSGSPPFSGDTALAVAVQHLNKEPKPLAAIRPDLPAAVCHIVHKMLTKNPDVRYASARELLRELRQLQREHFGDQWPEELPGWEVTGSEMPTQRPTEVTQRLDRLMKTVATPSYRRRGRLLWATGAVAAALAGVATAYFTVVPRPLLGSHRAAEVPRQSSALRQWYLASRAGNEESWQSVIKYFPKDEYLVHRAQQQLTRIYLREDKLDQAKKIFEELAALEPPDDQFKAFGLAGLCGVLSLQGHYSESANAEGELWPIRNKLKDDQIRQMLESAIERNRLKAGAPSSRQWQQWLEEHFQPTD